MRQIQANWWGKKITYKACLRQVCCFWTYFRNLPFSAWKTDVNSIDYSNPELYLTLGSQSNLKEQYFNEINRQIRIENNDIEGIGIIFSWKQDYFKRYSAGGRFIGKITVNQIMKKRR